MTIRNKRIKMVLLAILALFIFTMLYLTYFQISKASEIIQNPYNARLWVDEKDYTRGTIFDRNMTALAITEGESGTKIRKYPFGSTFSHEIGYSSTEYGKTGLEESFNKVLLDINDESPTEDIRKMVVDNKIGNSIQSTLDLDLQEYVYRQLEGHKGSIVVMNPKTGEVYAMASLPTYNPNELSSEWSNLITDNEAPLLNRSTQGLYTPGSIIKMLTSVAIIEEKEKIDLEYFDEGEVVIDGYTISNFENIAHGTIDLNQALMYSSNTYFAVKAKEVGAEKLKEVYDRFMFNKDIPSDVAIEDSFSPFEAGMPETELVAAAFGQGKTLVTPINMALAISSIANDGVMMRPIFVKSIIGSDGEIKEERHSSELSRVTDANTAKELKEYLRNVVNNYHLAQLDGIESGGKTGTAETASGLTHASFIGFAPYENPRLAVAVILEEDGTLGGTSAAPIARDVLQKGLEIIAP